MHSCVTASRIAPSPRRVQSSSSSCSASSVRSSATADSCAACAQTTSLSNCSVFCCFISRALAIAAAEMATAWPSAWPAAVRKAGATSHVAASKHSLLGLPLSPRARSMAASSAVKPRLFCSHTSAPLRTSSLTSDVWPPSAARISAV